jgi:Haloacid dehalogenase-like hydrolase
MRGVIFDLDGTLVDSLGDIAAAMNRTLAARGFPTHPLEAYRSFVGEGVRKLAERALPAEALDEVTSLVAAYQADYAEHLLQSSAPYPGILELLEALFSRGVPMTVLSNKPDAPPASWWRRSSAGGAFGASPASALAFPGSPTPRRRWSSRAPWTSPRRTSPSSGTPWWTLPVPEPPACARWACCGGFGHRRWRPRASPPCGARRSSWPSSRVRLRRRAWPGPRLTGW